MRKIKSTLANFSIKGRILMLAIILCVLTLIAGIISICGLALLSDEYKHLLDTAIERRVLTAEFATELKEIRLDVCQIVIQSEFYKNESSTEDYYNKALDALDEFLATADTYYNNVTGDHSLTKEAQDKLLSRYESLIRSINIYADCIDKIFESSVSDDKSAVNEKINEISSLAVDAEENTNALVKAAYDREVVLKDEVNVFNRNIMIIITILIILVIILSILISLSTSKQILKPITTLTSASDKIARGDFNVNVKTNQTNEIGKLSNNFAMLVDSFRSIVNDMNSSFSAMNNGNIGARIDTAKFEGEYGTIAKNINSMLESTANELLSISKSAEEYAYGNFDYQCPRFPGEKAILHESFDTMKEHLYEINSSIDLIISGINEGNLNISVDTNKFNGAWKELGVKLNSLVSNVAKPIRETKTALSEISKGNFKINVDSNKYKGEFKEMLSDIGNTVSVLSSYITEISDILQTMANQNLNVSIDHEYIGDFSAIQVALNLIIDNFNNLINEIIVSSEQVSIGSQSISDSATALAQGASEQSRAVKDLTNIIVAVSENTKKNMQNVTKSNELADSAKESAEYVRAEMNDLLRAMEEINESSNNISNIIKAIDDIAFQTNILALNAAVEAARAGEHGKGFAVVAEEVRNLASRSQASAKETSELISIALEKAEQGNEIAGRTANTVSEITKQIEEISAISTEIFADSQNQNSSINEINTGINQIAAVVENNTSTSEQNAAASQELSSQSTIFKETVSKFMLKN